LEVYMGADDDAHPEAVQKLRFGDRVDLFFEDFESGQHFELGQCQVTEEEMLEFALRFDPQPFHVDTELARETVFGGLIASGWQTGAIWMRLYWDGLLHRAASLGSPGIEKLRWLAPVRPGDILLGTVDVVSTQASERHPERGTVIVEGGLKDPAGVVKMQVTAWGLLGRRPD
jgi:acyl dehydratase